MKNLNANKEEELIELIKNKSINEVKEIFKSKKVKLEELNFLQDTLLDLFPNNRSFDIIKIFIDKPQQQSINNTDILFLCVECHLFKIAKLALNYGTAIDSKNTDSKNIIEYLIEKKKLEPDNLLFILSIKDDASLISTESLCQLISMNKHKVLEKLFKFKYIYFSKYYNILAL